MTSTNEVACLDAHLKDVMGQLAGLIVKAHDGDVQGLERGLWWALKTLDDYKTGQEVRARPSNAPIGYATPYDFFRRHPKALALVEELTAFVEDDEPALLDMCAARGIEAVAVPASPAEQAALGRAMSKAFPLHLLREHYEGATA